VFRIDGIAAPELAAKLRPVALAYGVTVVTS